MNASLSRLQSFYGDLPASSLLRVMIKEEFPGTIALLTSFDADALALLALVAAIDASIPILFLDTGKHFSETISYAGRLEKQLGLANLKWLKPDPSLLESADPQNELWKVQPGRCCWLRKVEPLNRTIEEMGLLAIITGRKRYQTPERANLHSIELDENGIFRINPLADWNKDDQREAMQSRLMPPHPLLAQGYTSIGCAPCTLPVPDGQDERTGHWVHTVGFENEQKTECGITIPASSTNWSV